MHTFTRVLGATLLLSSAFRSIAAQEATRPSSFAIGGGAQRRATGAVGERSWGGIVEVIARRPRAILSPRAHLSFARFGSPFAYEGRLCNPDGPCDYYAPRVMVLSEAVGAEWPTGIRRARFVAALAAYQVLSPPVQGPSTNDPGARRGVRKTGGIHAGLVAPLNRRVDVEVRYEWLAEPIESTRYFVPLVVRYTW